MRPVSARTAGQPGQVKEGKTGRARRGRSEVKGEMGEGDKGRGAKVVAKLKLSPIQAGMIKQNSG